MIRQDHPSFSRSCQKQNQSFRPPFSKGGEVSERSSDSPLARGETLKAAAKRRRGRKTSRWDVFRGETSPGVPRCGVAAKVATGDPRSRLPARSALLPSAEVSTGHPRPSSEGGNLLTQLSAKNLLYKNRNSLPNAPHSGASGNPLQGRGCPVDTSANGRSADRAGRRESPRQNSPPDCFAYLPDLANALEFRVLRDARRALPSTHRLLKKAGENFNGCFLKWAAKGEQNALYHDCIALPKQIIQKHLCAAWVFFPKYVLKLQGCKWYNIS